MFQFPELVLIKIFKYLPIYDLLMASQTSKLWRSIANSLLSNEKELILFFRTITRPLLWYHNDQPINLTNSIIINSKFKCSEYLKETFKNITNLYIATYEEIFANKKEFDEFINHFECLENLQIFNLNDVIESVNPYEINLNLPNLQTFFLGHNDKVEHLNCPKLIKLSIIDHFVMNANFISLINSLKFLKVKSFSYHPLFKLINLEILYVSKNILINFSDFPKLKQIHLFHHKKAFRIDSVREQILRGLFEQKQNLRRDDLQIFYEGMKCTETTINEVIERNQSRYGSLFYYKSYEYYRENQDEFNFKNIEKILKYSDSFNQELKNISRTDNLLNCIQHLYFGKKLKDEINFKNWEHTFKYVTKIVIRKLSQDHLDQLPDFIPNLIEFSFFTGNSDKNKVINFEFISKFKALKCFNIEKGFISLDEFKLVVDKCRFFYYAIFIPSIHCRLEVDNYYLRTTRYKERFDFKTKTQLFNFLNDKNLIVKNV